MFAHHADYICVRSGAWQSCGPWSSRMENIPGGAPAGASASAGVVVAEAVDSDVPEWLVMGYEKVFREAYPDGLNNKEPAGKVGEVEVAGGAYGFRVFDKSAIERARV